MARLLNQLFEFLSRDLPAAAGEGLESSVTHTWLWPAWLTLLLLLSSAILVAWCYARERTDAGRGVRWLLSGIRIALLALVMFMLYGWMRERHRTDLADVAVVIDSSASMATEDQYTDSQVRAEITNRTQALGFERATRSNFAKSVLLENDAAIWNALRERYHVRLYSAGASVKSKNSGDGDEAQAIREIPADEPVSRLGKAVADVLQLQRGRPTAALILLTDGITTDGKTLSEAAEQARRQQVPLYLIGVGNDQAPRDLKISDLLVDDVAFVNDQLHFDFKLSGSGYEGKSVTVRVVTKGNSSPLAEKSVAMGKDGESQSTRLTIRPQQKGEHEFLVEVEPQAGETTTQNNSLARIVMVSEETIRILYVQGYPNYDFRFLKTLLGRELKTGTETHEKSFDFKTVLQEADLEYAQQDETAERVFPVSRDELFAYDVLLFGDCNPRQFGQAVLNNIADFVKVRGGSMVMTAGPRFTPLAYRDTPLADLIPLTMESLAAPDPDIPLIEPFSAHPTALGLTTPFLQLADSPEENLRLWSSMPPFYWNLDGAEARPGARVFVEHGGRTGLNGQHLPLVTLQFVGAGKVLFHSTDEIWRWSRQRDGDRYYARYWIQMLRYLSRTRLLGGNRAVHLTTDRDQYERGESVRLRIRFMDERIAPPQDDGVLVVLERQGSGKRNVPLSRDASQRGDFDGTIDNLMEGEYNAWLASPALEGRPPSARFTITQPKGEQARLEMDTADMRAAAKASVGRFYTLSETDKLLSDLPSGRHVRIESLPAEPLWNWWPLPTLFVTLIVSEWLLRKRAGML